MKRFLKYFSILFFAAIVLAAGAGAGVYYWAARDLPTLEKITDYEPHLTTTVQARDGEVMGYLSKERRFQRSLEEMSSHVPKAFLAAEDSNFYEHRAIDFMGILRAAYRNLMEGEIVQGGSTITQQVVKSLLLSPERSYQRKLKEAILAYRLESYLSKDEILTIYLNQIYLGQRAYGVEAAARKYFNKHADELTLSESAMLAGLPTAPSLYNPFRNEERAKQRQQYVLRQMLDKEWITSDQYEQAVEESIELRTEPDPTWNLAPSYLEEVRRWLVDEYGEEKVYRGGLQVRTAMDIEHQEAAQEALESGLEASTKRRGWRGPLENLSAEEASDLLSGQDTQKMKEDLREGEWIRVVVDSVREDGARASFANETAWLDVSEMSWCREPDPSKAPEDVPPVHDAREVLQEGDLVWASYMEEIEEGPESWRLRLEQRPLVQGGFFAMEPDDGAVRALVGGYDYSTSQFNRATQAKRQPGSAFKPFVFSAALDRGLTTSTMILDAPIVYEDPETDTTWKPRNYERLNFGPTLFRTALVNSRNLATIRVAREIGIYNVIDRARTMGLEGHFPMDLSASLGTASVSLQNMSKAFSGFARFDGDVVEPQLVLEVTDRHGETLYESETITSEAISPRNSYIMTELMQEVVQDGTGWRVKRAIDRPVAGKTGTTDNQRDAWYMGYSPNLLAGVHVGFDRPRSMGKYETGSRAAAPIWIDYWKQVQSEYPDEDFQRPEGIVMARVDAENGLLAGPGTENSYMLPFEAGTQPREVSTARRGDLDSSSDERGSSSDEDDLQEIF